MSFDEGRALVIGIGDYLVAEWSAPQTVGDATGVADALKNSSVAGYLADRVTVLSDDVATRSGILDALDQLAISAQQDDTVVVFYAGHGLLDALGEYTLTAHDSTFVGRDRVATGTGIPESTLLEKLRAIKAEKVLLIINACFSGFVGAALGPADAAPQATVGAPPTNNLVNRVLGTGEGRAVLTACRASQESWFLRGGTKTFFGQAVQQALLGTGIAPDVEYIGIWDLYTSVFNATQAAAAGLPGSPVQQPVMSIRELVGTFPVALAASARVRALGPMTPIAQGPPAGTAANIVPGAVVDAARSFVPGEAVLDVRFASAPVTRTRGADVNEPALRGGVPTTNVGGEDLNQITLKTTPESAASASSAADVVAHIEDIRADVGRLSGVDQQRADIVRELDQATAASAGGDVVELLRTLDRARDQLQGLGTNVPAALPLSESVSTLMQRSRTVLG